VIENIPSYYVDQFAIHMKYNKVPIDSLVNRIFEEEFRMYY
jgi:hypothetical protein